MGVPGADAVLHGKLSRNFTTIETVINALNDKNFAPYAKIDVTKFANSIKTQQETSVTHKQGHGGAPVDSRIIRRDQSCFVYPPQSIGREDLAAGAQNYIDHDLANGELAFYTTNIARAFVDSAGWNNGVPPGTDPVQTEMTIDFDPLLSFWTVKIGTTERAYVDANVAVSVFTNVKPAAGAVSTGASIDFSVANRINFRASFDSLPATVIGHITTGGTVDGA